MVVPARCVDMKFANRCTQRIGALRSGLDMEALDF